MRITNLAILLFISLHASAQLPVRLEPHHHNVFENERVRALDVFFGPGDTSFYHLHATPSIFIMLSNTQSGSQLYGQQPESGPIIAGDISYDELKTPRYHRVWNSDTSWFQVIDIELPGKPSGATPSSLAGAGIVPLFNEAQANGYRLEPKAGDKITIPALATGYFLVSLGEAEVRISSPDGEQHRFMKAGHYQWLPGKGMTTLTNVGAAPMGFGLIQLK